MFYGLENTQSEVASLLEKLIKEDSFPRCVLFTGPQYSSRMYAAMSVAKHFNADINSTVIISDRNHSYRIKCALKLYESARNKAAGIFLFNTVDPYLKQFHGALFDSSSSTVKKKFSDAGDCMELISSINKLNDNEIPSFCSKLEKSLSSLGYSKASAISINQIRAIREWANTSSLDGKLKFVIIEGLENSTPSASNSLLKILEEPPEDTYFIILSSNAGRIPSTVLSRVQKIAFKPYTENENRFFFNSIFVNPSQYKDVKSFFIKYSGVDENLLNECAEALVNNKEFNLPELVKELESTQSYDRFFELTVQALYELFKKGSVDFPLDKLVYDIEDHLSKAAMYNQVNRLTLDYVIYRIQEVVK